MGIPGKPFRSPGKLQHNTSFSAVLPSFQILCEVNYCLHATKSCGEDFLSCLEPRDSSARFRKENLKFAAKESGATNWSGRWTDTRDKRTEFPHGQSWCVLVEDHCPTPSVQCTALEPSALPTNDTALPGLPPPPTELLVTRRDHLK